MLLASKHVWNVCFNYSLLVCLGDTFCLGIFALMFGEMFNVFRVNEVFKRSI